MINLNGAIGMDGPGRKGLSMQRLEKTIEAAFKPKKLAAVALAINSPGGSPVQSRLIHNAIRRHADEKKVPVLAFVEDVGASGGYILAIAGDEIYADESSIVGSIGVISAGFGFTEMIAKIGIERRVNTAGENKSTLDPFKPQDPEEVERLKTILNDLHDQFISLVRARRPGKLADDKSIFSGEFWTAPRAQKLGLIDGIAQLGDFLRARYGKDVKIKRISPESGSLLKRLLSGHVRPALVDSDEIIDAVERRALWARFGL
ncbi:MAG: S49 family peptidase [Pseudomonadota bacterium]